MLTQPKTLPAGEVIRPMSRFILSAVVPRLSADSNAERTLVLAEALALLCEAKGWRVRSCLAGEVNAFMVEVPAFNHFDALALVYEIAWRYEQGSIGVITREDQAIEVRVKGQTIGRAGTAEILGTFRKVDPSTALNHTRRVQVGSEYYIAS